MSRRLRAAFAAGLIAAALGAAPPAEAQFTSDGALLAQMISEETQAVGQLTQILQTLKSQTQLMNQVLTGEPIQDCSEPWGSVVSGRDLAFEDEIAPRAGGQRRGLGERPFFSSRSLSRQESASMSITWQCWAKRSTSAPRHGASPKRVPHCL